MSKTKSSDQPHYELLYLISNQYSEDEIKPIIGKVQEMIAANGGQITFQEDWGKKRLSYQIKGFRFGYYNLIEFDADGEKLKQVDQLLRLNSEILRFQIVKKKIKTAQEIEQEQKIQKKIEEKAALSEREATVEEVVEDQEIKREKEKDKEKSKKKVELKDLDEKLDRILETDDLL
jgi:small subunit ribosomal protein S6